MKTLIITALLLSIVTVCAQTAGAPANQALRDTRPYTIVSRSANARVWQRTDYTQGPSGVWVTNVHGYTELADGVCHKDISGNWVDSSEAVVLQPDGTAAATNCATTVYFPADIGSGEIRLVTSDGKVLQNGPSFLAFNDGTTTVIIGAVTNSVGELISSNQVLYPDIFRGSGFRADLEGTVRKSGYESDLIFREQIPDPKSLGLGADARLELWTEWYNTPDPTQRTNAVQKDANGLADATLKFGSAIIGRGKAFSVGAAPSNPGAVSTPVYKRWTQIRGRPFLVESLPYRKIAPHLEQLPASSSVAVSSKPIWRGGSIEHGVPSRARFQPRANRIQLAKSENARGPGVVLDYVEIDSGSGSALTLQSGVTYFVTGTYVVGSQLSIEEGTVVKFENGNNASIEVEGGDIVCNASLDSSAIFTDMNDNSVGEYIWPGNGDPTVNDAVYLDTFWGSQVMITNAVFKYASIAICANDYTFFDLWNCQFLNCSNAIAPGQEGGTVLLQNVLFGGCSYAIEGSWAESDQTITAEQVTADVQNFVGVDELGEYVGTIDINITNSIVNTSTGDFSDYPDYLNSYGYDCNLSTNASVFNPPGTYFFESGPGGNYYLANDSYHDMGTTNIDPDLLSELATMTTYAPQEGYHPDNGGIPDLGWHYPANEDSDHDGLPDWWEWQNLGTYAYSGSTLDSAGRSLLYDYQHSITPTGPYNVGWIGFWTFDTPDWIGSPGLVPIATNLLDLVPGLISNAVHVAHTNSNLRYNIVESNGHTNLALQNGSVLLWYKPDWSSVDQGGTGPGFIPIGNGYVIVDFASLVSVDSTAGYWDIYFDYRGTNLWFSSGDGTNQSGDLVGTISWASNQWHQIAVTYSPSNSTLYVDGTAIDQTNGVPFVPIFGDFADENNFSVGNNIWINPAEGAIDELETFNYPLSAAAVFQAYTNAACAISITGQPQNQAVMVGSNATFAVAASSQLPLYYQWYYDTNTPLVGATNASLTFTVETSSRGIYSVAVSNIAASVFSTNATLTLFGDSDSNGLGDEWEMEYFGHLGNDPDTFDGIGHTFLYDYQHGIDPLTFLLLTTNRFVNTTSVPVKVLLTGGIPYYYTYIADPTNFNGVGSNWYSYVSSNITVTFSPTEGEHDVLIGLRDSPTNADPAWVEVAITFDTNAPVITVTNPAAGATVSEPMIQIQGYVNKNVRAITFDVTNAAGLLTNQTGYIIGEFFDTNAVDFTTNYFQLYDVPLTNGANTIIIHATDLAGNTATTNLSVTLNYSNDTMPPVLQLVWPQDGTKVAGNSFTLKATIDDTLAIVTATVANSSGTSPTVFGTVQRNGNVWLPNLPLTPGPNTVTITVTDPAGNTSTTTINVVGNPATDGITMEPIAALNQSSIAVTGTVTVANANSVLANGITATLDGSGNWTAQNVPVNATGVASVEVDVLDSSKNLLAEQVFNQQQPVATTRVAFSDCIDYVDTFHFGNLYTNNSSGQPVLQLAQDCWKTLKDNDDFHWTLGTEAVYFTFSQFEDVYCSNAVGTTEDTNKYYATNDMSWALSWAYGPTNYRCYADIDAPYADPGDYGANTLKTRTKLVADNGGEGQLGATQLYLVRASVTELGYFYTGRIPLPPEWVQIGGKTLINTGVMNPVDGAVWGETFIQAPAGVKPDITPVATRVYTNWEYTFPTVTVQDVTLQSLTVVSNSATQVNSTNWATVMTPTNNYVIVQATLSTTDTNAANLIQWSGGEAVPGNPFQRQVSTATSAETAVTATLASTNMSLNVWIIWSQVLPPLVSGATPANALQLWANLNPTNNSLYYNLNQRCPGTTLGVRYYTNADSEYDAGICAWGKMCAEIQITPSGINQVITNGWAVVQMITPHEFQDGTNSPFYFDYPIGDGPPPYRYTSAPDTSDIIYSIDGPEIRPNDYGSKIYYEMHNNFFDELRWNGTLCSPTNVYWHWQANWNTNQTPQINHIDLGTGTNLLPTTDQWDN